MLRIAEGTIAGIAAGIITGIGARIAMRLVAIGVADGVGVRPEFTLAGSLAIVVAGAIVGAPLGAAYAALEPRLPRPPRAHGLWFAALVLVLVGPLFLTTEEFFSSGRVALFTSLFPVFGLAVGLGLAIVERFAPRMPHVLQRLLAAVAIGGGALVLFGLAGIAGEKFERHGAVAIAYAVPWIVLAVLAAPALRAQLARVQVAR